MSHENSQPDLDQLITDHLEDALDDVGHARLAKMLRDEPAARKRFAQLMTMHVLVEAAMHSERPPVAWPSDAALKKPRKEQPPPIPPSPSVQPASRIGAAWKRSADAIQYHATLWMVVSLMFTVVGIATLIVWITPDAKDDDAVAFSDPVMAAKLTGLSDVNWSSDANRWQLGVTLAAGRKLQLKSGLAELTFVDGAEVVLQGPCDFTLDAPGAGTLQLGKLAAHVPPDARGFAIHTPTARVVDFGTEFGVEVASSGDTEVAVLTGEVDMVLDARDDRPAQRVRLTAGQGAFVAMNGDTIARRSQVDARFVSAMRSQMETVMRESAAQARATTALVAHWKFDDNADDSVGSHHGTPHGDVGFAPGKFGQAATFDGDGDFVTIGGDPLPLTNFTLAAWVYAVSTATPMQVAGTQSSNDRGAFLRVRNNGSLSGTVLPGSKLIHAAYSRPDAVPEGAWTHVAMTVSRTEGLKLFIDGLEAAADAAGTAQLSINNFTIGRRSDSPPDGSYHFWSGLIDDVAVWEGVLSDDQLRHVIQHGAQHYNRDVGATPTEPAR